METNNVKILINRFENIKANPPEERLKSKSAENLINSNVCDNPEISVAERKRKFEIHKENIDQGPLKKKNLHRSVDSYLNDIDYSPDKR